MTLEVLGLEKRKKGEFPADVVIVNAADSIFLDDVATLSLTSFNATVRTKNNSV